MTTVLLTGYEPFGEFERNPAAEIADDLDGTRLSAGSIVGRTLPVAFERAKPELIDHLDDHAPEIVVSLGLAAGRPTMNVERVGINLRDTGDVPDNDDRDVVDEPVDADGPDAYFSTLPVRAMCEAMRDGGVPASLSTSAGTHLCNNILYATRRYVETTDLEVRSGFVHVPMSHEQAAARGDRRPSMALETMVRGIELGLEAALEAIDGPAEREPGN